MFNKYSIYLLPSDLLKVTAKKHRIVRKKLGMTQAELAERAGVSLGSLKRFEQTGKISFESLLKLAHILNHLKDFEHLFEQQEDLQKIEQLFSDKTRK